MTTPMMADLSTWSISTLSSDNTTDIFNKSHSMIQSFERVSSVKLYILICVI